jgi:hypothetical protein
MRTTCVEWARQRAPRRVCGTSWATAENSRTLGDASLPAAVAMRISNGTLHQWGLVASAAVSQPGTAGCAGDLFVMGGCPQHDEASSGGL